MIRLGESHTSGGDGGGAGGGDGGDGGGVGSGDGGALLDVLG